MEVRLTQHRVLRKRNAVGLAHVLAASDGKIQVRFTDAPNVGISACFIFGNETVLQSR